MLKNLGLTAFFSWLNCFPFIEKKHWMHHGIDSSVLRHVYHVYVNCIYHLLIYTFAKKVNFYKIVRLRNLDDPVISSTEYIAQT